MRRDPIPVDDALERLRKELAVLPSAHFESRVRAVAVGSTVRRAGLALARHGVIALAALACIAVAMSVWSAGSSDPAAKTVGSIQSVARAASLAPPSSGGVATAVEESDDERIRGSKTAGAKRARPSPASSDPGSSGARFVFEVLVPPDQARALAQLLAAARSGAVPAERPIAVDPETGELLPPRPIEIAVLPAIPPLDPTEGGTRRDR
jgi:hypothetical protein